MRILILSPFLWSGAGAAITHLAIDFTRRGHHCDIVSSGESRGLRDWESYVREITRAGIGYRQIDLFDREASSVWKSIKSVTELISGRNYDLIHVHSGVAAFVASIARDNTRSRVPIIATFHSWNPLRPEWMNWSDIWALNRCDRIVADSTSYLKYLVEQGIDQEKAEVIHLGVVTPARAVKRPLVSQRKIFRVLSVGRIERRKNQETLIRAFALFREKVPFAVLHLVGPTGEQDYERRIRNRSSRYNWDLGVHLTGMVDDVGEYYRQADLYVSTSLDEGLGLALLEAMAHGLPSLSTRIPGHQDFARDGENTWEIPTRDHRIIAERMLDLFHNPEAMNLLGCEARATVESRFAWSSTVDQYARLYRQAVKL